MTEPTKERPETLAIRAKPRPVTRLSRKALAGLLGGAAVVVLGGAIWALRPPMKPKAPDELYSVDRRATAEGLNRLPRNYAGLGTGVAVPQLGPPLPGDLGEPILRAQQDGRIPEGAIPQVGPVAPSSAADQMREDQIKTAHEAIGSPLFSASSTPAVSAADLGADGPHTGAIVPALSLPTSDASATRVELTPSRHEAFARAASGAPTVSAHRLTSPESPFTIMAGTVISAALVTGLNSDLPGQIIATVTVPVFDSVTGRTILIPQGARVLGTYDSQTAFGESRAMVVWTRLILPDGRSLLLDRLLGVDAQGHAGLTDVVDRHWRRLAGGALVSSLLGVSAELTAPPSSGARGDVIVAVRDGAQDSVNQAGQELTRRNLGIKPTIRVRPGFPLRIVVAVDLVLAPYLPPSR
ncbi:TrbI/VirB10 family protein [Phenylobacterium sp.]|uniref:TrbI/VirB10 family protein n=1 Tax=Phenylobacterium sp. TaxID=1871053 RepID=UPI002FCAAEEC